jgi:hypothetical protein
VVLISLTPSVALSAESQTVDPRSLWSSPPLSCVMATEPDRRSITLQSSCPSHADPVAPMTVLKSSARVRVGERRAEGFGRSTLLEEQRPVGASASIMPRGHMVGDSGGSSAGWAQHLCFRSRNAGLIQPTPKPSFPLSNTVTHQRQRTRSWSAPPPSFRSRPRVGQ